MYSCTMSVLYPGEGGAVGMCPEEAVRVLKKITHTVMVLGFSMNCTTVMRTVKRKSNSQTSLHRAIVSPTDSWTFLLRAVC